MLSTQWLLMKRCDRLSCGEGRPHEPAAWYSIPLQNVTRRRELLENMQMRKYFIYFISLQGSSTTKLILGGLCDVWEGNINSVSLPVWKFFMADKKKQKKTEKTSFVSNWFWVFCCFFLMLKLCMYEKGMPSVGVVTLFSFTTCTLCQIAVLPRGTLQFTTPQFGTARADVAVVWSIRWQDLHRLHEQGGISPSMAQQKPVQRIIRRKNFEFGNISCFFLLLFLFLGYSAASSVLSILNHWAWERKSATYF